MSSLFRDRAFALPLAVVVSGLVFVVALLYRPVPAAHPVAASQGYGAGPAPAAGPGPMLLVGVGRGVLTFVFLALLIFFTFLFVVETAVKFAGWVGDRTPLGRMGLAQ